MRFRSTIAIGNGRNATGFEVPADVVQALASGKRPPVVVTLNEHRYRSTIAVLDGVFMLPLAAEHREAAGVAAGDQVDVDIELDTEPRLVEAPPDLADALAADADAKAFWDTLSYSHQRRHVLAVEGAKTPETRARRVAKAMEMLRSGVR